MKKLTKQTNLSRFFAEQPEPFTLSKGLPLEEVRTAAQAAGFLNVVPWYTEDGIESFRAVSAVQENHNHSTSPAPQLEVLPTEAGEKVRVSSPSAKKWVTSRQVDRQETWPIRTPSSSKAKKHLYRLTKLRQHEERAEGRLRAQLARGPKP